MALGNSDSSFVWLLVAEVSKVITSSHHSMNMVNILNEMYAAGIKLLFLSKLIYENLELGESFGFLPKKL